MKKKGMSMTNGAFKYLGATALIAQVVLLYGCSSGGGTTAGTGGSTATASGGSSGAGTGGVGGASAMVDPPVGLACTVKNHAVCTTDPPDVPCHTTCGPNKSGYKNCACIAEAWSCPTCSYLPGTDLSCYAIKATTVACPADPTDSSGMMLPASGGTCTLPACTPCGSAAANAYRDSTGAPKSGYCVCVPNADSTMPSLYSCASIKEYPPQM